MKTFATTVTAAYVVGIAFAAAAKPQGVQQPSGVPVPNDAIVQGCFSSSGDLQFVTVPQWNSRGSCGVDTCQKMGKLVAATTGGKECWCGDKYPARNTVVEDNNCNIPCTGFGDDACMYSIPSSCHSCAR
jgi:cell wall integrity and stress response component